VVKAAVDAIGRGGLIVFTDDADRENEGDVVIAADTDTPETIALRDAATSLGFRRFDAKTAGRLRSA
jgi:3,4-dihydroxy-2-butanone 4-phosphate synthase